MPTKTAKPKPYTGVAIRTQLPVRVHRALKAQLAREGRTIAGWLHAMVEQTLSPPPPCPLAAACPFAQAAGHEEATG